MMQRRQAKANLYVTQLDRARCEGDWNEVPELIRKVSKHVPGRQCLVVTAHSEHQLAAFLSTRPATASSRSTSALTQLIPPLLKVVETETVYVEDALQGLVCIAWLHRTTDEPRQALERLPDEIVREWGHLAGVVAHPIEWTRVCVIKAVYIKAASHRDLGDVPGAIVTLLSALPLAGQQSHASSGPELRKWTERLLIEGCLLSSQVALSSGDESAEETNLTFFRAWAKHWEEEPGQGVPMLGGPSAKAGMPRRYIWRDYFATLSSMMHHGWPEAPRSVANSAVPSPTFTPRYVSTVQLDSLSIKRQRKIELQHVQNTYEGLILREVRFPKANENSEEVRAWVEAVMGNLRVLCGKGWQETELGEGGKEGIARNVLDILYRASTKSFHSTPILRHLFTIHASLAEFDLAFKALDAYIEIVARGKARVDKSGEEEPDLDNDDLALETAGAGIAALCAFGNRKEAERAKDIASLMGSWLKQNDFKNNTTDPTAQTNGVPAQDEGVVTRAPILPRTVAAAHRAIGIGLAHWASLIYDAPLRADLRSQAIAHCRKAVSPDLEDARNIESLFALSLLLAEARDLAGALEVVKEALLPENSSLALPDPILAGGSPGTELGPPHGFERERRLVPLWHLLALILSARQDFAAAVQACAAAFEQFTDPRILFGTDLVELKDDRDRPMNDMVDEGLGPPTAGLVDEMDLYEREALLQIKMTQMALVEVTEGPDMAVNASDELLSLYGRLFGNPKIRVNLNRSRASTVVPKSSNGTFKSLRGTLIGRKRSKRKSVRQTESTDMSAPEPEAAQTIDGSVDQNEAPAIQVTDENGGEKSHEHEHERNPDHTLFHYPSKHRGEKLQKRSGNASLKSKRSGGSIRRKRGTTSSETNRQDEVSKARTNESAPAKSEKVESATRPSNDRGDRQWRNSITPSQVGIAVSADVPALAPAPRSQQQRASAANPLPLLTQNLPQERAPLPFGRPGDSGTQDVRLPIRPGSPSTQPGPRIPQREELRLRVSLLVNVWLLIAGLYRRAELYDDAKGAVEEAVELVEELDSDRPRAQANTTEERGARIEEMWADLAAERGLLSRAQGAHHDALAHYELALSRSTDHPAATVGLSEILLDIAEGIVPAHVTTSELPSSMMKHEDPILAHLSTQQHRPEKVQSTRLAPLGFLSPPSTANPGPDKTKPRDLSRLAARDRAHGLLSALTKLGSGWDCSEAWMLLARAYELGGQADRAREVLWWVVELEEGRGVRDWGVVGGRWGRGRGVVL
ncbi:MAG: hypothetical protein M1832_001594 [Thelocarpon impressellum]|nr:MAG: hypothetical protein M1832_001594 [Thelocarpon impressellum]